MSWSRDPVMWSRRHPYFNQTATKFQYTYLFRWSYEAIAYASILWCQAYLWFAAIRGHGGGFLWRSRMRPQLLKPLTYSKPSWCAWSGEMSEPLDAAGSALWWRKTSASWCPLWESVGEVSRSYMRLETC